MYHGDPIHIPPIKAHVLEVKALGGVAEVQLGQKTLKVPYVVADGAKAPSVGHYVWMRPRWDDRVNTKISLVVLSDARKRAESNTALARGGKELMKSLGVNLVIGKDDWGVQSVSRDEVLQQLGKRELATLSWKDVMSVISEKKWLGALGALGVG